MLIVIFLCAGIFSCISLSLVQKAYAETNTFRAVDNNMYIDSGTCYLDSNGNYGIGMNLRLAGPERTGSLMESYTPEPAYDYIMYHGYPYTNTINGRTWSDKDAHAIMQYTAWLLDDYDYTTTIRPADAPPGSFGLKKENDYTGPSDIDLIHNAAKSLYRSAIQYHGGGVEDGYARCWHTDAIKASGNHIQDILSLTPLGSISIHKSSANTTFTNGNSKYSLSGAIYGVYGDANCTIELGTITTDANGNGSLSRLREGPVWIKEKTASRGYRLDTATYTATIPGHGSAHVDVKEQPQRGKIKVAKASSGLWSLEYKTYSLASALYEVRDSTGKLWTTLTTDAAGNATSMDLPLGTYTLKEIVAPKGFRLNITPFNVSINTDGVTTTGSTSDRPTTWTEIHLGVKTDYNRYNDNKNYQAQGGGSLSEAEYELAYYDGYYTTAAELSSLTAKNITKIYTTMSSDEAVIDIGKANQKYDGSAWGLPLGTYALREVKAPTGYHLDNTTYVFQCTQDSAKNGVLYLARSSAGVYAGITQQNPASPIEANNKIVSPEMIQRGDFSLMKYIENTTDADKYPEQKIPAAGVKFEIINDNEYDVQRVDTGEWISKGNVVYTLTTDEQGYASTKWETTDKGNTGIKNNNNQTGQSPSALAFGSYIVCEVPETTPDGYAPIKDYHFSIDANNTYKHQTFENKTGTVVRINKTDIGTERKVSGTTKVRILDKDKMPVTFDIMYPTPIQLTTLDTALDGSVILPSKLMTGNYYIEEIQAPEGYLYTDQLIPFTIDSSTVNTYDDPMDISFPNKPAMGQIHLTKFDTETNRPITEAAATYDVYAAEDIITQDGTTRARQGDKVDTFSTDGEGMGSSKELFLGHYYIQEAKAPEGYLINHDRIDVHLQYIDDRTPVSISEVSAYDEPVKGTIGALKTDSVSNAAIAYAGTKFEIRAAENIVGKDKTHWYVKGDLIDTIETDKTGIAQSEKLLPLGEYEVVEISAPYGYVLDSTPVPVELQYADQNTKFVSASANKSDLLSTGDFIFEKLDRETAKTVFTPGCEIAVYADEDIKSLDGRTHYHRNDYIGSATTDATGKVISKLNLPCGKYRLQEVNAPYEYVLDNERQYQVEIAWDGGKNAHTLYDAAISDVPAKGVITFTKADIETGKTIPAAGIKADIYANEDIITGDGTIRAHTGEKVAELETDENGIAATPELYLGNYRVIETFAPEGYLINTTPVNVSLNYEGQTVPVVTSATQILDENAKGVIEIVKIDKETGKTVTLPGTTFEIRAKTDIITGDGTVRVPAGELACDPVVTDENGTATTPELYFGIYTITETKAPHGYTLDTTPHDAVIAYKDQHTPVVFATESVANTAQKGVIQVTKTDSESGQPILTPGAIFEIRATEDIVTPDGTLRAQAGDIVDTIETDNTGIASSRALYLGKYEIYETQAPAGYLLSEEVKQVELVYGDQTVPLVYEMISIADQSVKGTITVNKEDSDLDEPLPGVVYEIRAAEDITTGDGVTHHMTGDVVETLVTGDDGSATSADLYLGEYVVVETVQPNSYIIDEKEYPVYLRYADQHTPVVHEDITLYNTPTTVHVKKVSLNDNTLVIPGTQFVGWRVEEEADIDDAFAVFAGEGIEITRASIDYLGDFTQTGAKEVQESFELTRQIQDEEASSYVVLSSGHSLSMGDYVLHVSYTRTSDSDTIDKDIPFVVNEYDKNAYFAIGVGIISTDSNADNFTSTNSDESDPEKPEEIITPTDPDSDETDNPSDPIPDTTEGIDNDAQAQDIVDDETTTDNNNINDPSNDKNPDNPEEGSDIVPAPDDNMNVPALSVPDASDEAEVRIDRVPAILSTGRFTWAVTGDDGIAEFKYVPQGQIAFAEFEPAAGYVSDRTPGYIEIGTNGKASNATVEGNISTPKTSAAETSVVDLDMVFADDLTKLYISKKDITTSDELPDNTLSVYEYEGDGTSDEVTDSDYGELVETWVSADEPHYMELLPQGTYILKEEQAVDGYTVAESIIFRLNDTGIEQHVLMNNEHETAVADELIDTMGQLGDRTWIIFAIGAFSCISVGVIVYRRKQN